MKTAGNTGLRFALTPLALSAALFIAACGGGNDGDAAPLAPTISAQPAEQSVVSGGVATFSVAANGDSLSYQWQRSSDGGATWTDISGATMPTYTVSSADQGTSGTKFRVVISSAGQSVTSSPVTLTVTAAVVAPVITVDVAAVAVTVGTNAVFSVTASGSALAYQWQTSTDGTTYTDVSGATGTSVTLPAVALADSGKTVRVAVTNGGGKITSAAASLYVTPAIADATITSQPLAASVTAPSAVTFTVGAAGTPAPTYQWQKSIDGGVTWADIAGATGIAYTTAATAIADSGSQFRVSVSNATASVFSDPATLTVAASAVPVAISSQPAAIAVTVPSTATFTVAASGSPTPTYQWQVKGTAAGSTFANITGATSASYTTPATTAADSGKQFQVVVTNGSGAVTSSPVTLTATAATTTSNLTGRAWTTGVSLETGDASVSTSADPVVGIDDAGTAISIFTKSDGTRSMLYATRGVPGAAGTAPVWSAPVAIDNAAAPAGTSTRLLTVAPNGNAAVTWLSRAPCTASTYSTSVNATCNYLYSSRYSPATNSWSAPVQMADTPNLNFAPTQFLNSEGDLAVAYPGWVRSGNSFTTKPAVLWQAAGQSAFQNRVFSELGNFALGMDKGGNLVVAGDAAQNSTTDLVAYRGSVLTGFRAQELLEQRTSAATYDNLAVGSNGQAIVTWYQNNGTSKTRFAASIDSPTAAWLAQDIGNEYNIGGVLTVTDAGVGILSQPCFLGSTGAFQRFSGGTWSGWQKFPGALNGCNRTSYTFNRNADILLFDSSDWTSYDAARNQVIRANTSSATSVYGTSGGSTGSSAAALSLNGIGVLTAAVPYDTLPTIAQPAGDGRSSVINLWGLFLK